MVDGLWHGEMITRGKAGLVLDRSPSVRGTGVYRIFTSDDRLAWEIPLQDGQRHGVVRRLCDGVWHEEQWCQGVREQPSA